MYSFKTTNNFEKTLKKLDKHLQKQILKWIAEKLIDCQNPRLYGKALKGNLKELWRYRIGNYRLICEIKDKELIILALEFGHRKNIYK